LTREDSGIQGVNDSTESPHGLILKEKIFALLKLPDFARKVGLLRKIPVHRILRTLLSTLCSEDEEIKWHAVTVTGMLVADLAPKDLEGARNVIRRMIWSLNEESGGIGWGIPEAMGEILARNETLAREFAPILLSFVQPEGNFLEFEFLQAGALWGIGRLAEVHPQLFHSHNAAKYLLSCMESTHPLVRGHAVWAAARIGIQGNVPKLENLLRDETEIRLYQNQRFRSVRICDLAKELFKDHLFPLSA
jgi:hypothetical protein